MKKLLLILAVAGLMFSCGESPLDKSIFEPLTQEELTQIGTENPELIKAVTGIQQYNLTENTSDADKKTFKDLTYRRFAEFINFMETQDIHSDFEAAMQALEKNDKLATEFAFKLFMSSMVPMPAPAAEPTTEPQPAE